MALGLMHYGLSTDELLQGTKFKAALEERVQVWEGSRSNRARRPRSCLGTQLAPSFHGEALLIRDPGQDDS